LHLFAFRLLELSEEHANIIEEECVVIACIIYQTPADFRWQKISSNPVIELKEKVRVLEEEAKEWYDNRDVWKKWGEKKAQKAKYFEGELVLMKE